MKEAMESDFVHQPSASSWPWSSYWWSRRSFSCSVHKYTQKGNNSHWCAMSWAHAQVVVIFLNWYIILYMSFICQFLKKNTLLPAVIERKKERKKEIWRKRRERERERERERDVLLLFIIIYYHYWYHITVVSEIFIAKFHISIVQQIQSSKKQINSIHSHPSP